MLSPRECEQNTKSRDGVLKICVVTSSALLHENEVLVVVCSWLRVVEVVLSTIDLIIPGLLEEQLSTMPNVSSR